MIDVSGRTDRQRHCDPSLLVPIETYLLHRGGHLGRLGIRQRAAVQEEAAVPDDADHRRIVEPEPRCESLLDGAGERRELRERQRAAPCPRDGLLDFAPDGGGEALGARANRGRVLEQHPYDGDPTRRLEIQRERRLERCERELVGSKRALEGVAAQALDEVAAADDDPDCGPPRSLSPEKHTRSAPPASASRGVGSPSNDAKAPDPRSSTSGSPCRRATAATSASAGRAANPTRRKFDWWTRRIAAVSPPTARS